MQGVFAVLHRIKNIFADVPFFCFGFAFLRAWVLTIGSTVSSAWIVTGSYSYTTVFDISCLIASAAMVIVSRYISPFFVNSKGRLLIGTMLILGTIAASFAVEFGFVYCFYLYAVFGGLGFAAAVLMWLEFYASLNPLRAVIYYSIARVLGDTFAWLLYGYMTPYLYTMLAGFVIAAFYCLRKCSSSISRLDLVLADRITKKIPLKATLCVALYAIVFSFIESSIITYRSLYPERLLWAIPLVIIIVGIALRPGKFTTSSVNHLLVFTMLIVVLMLLICNMLPQNIIADFVGIGSFSATVFGILVLGQISHRLRISALWLFGFARFFRYAGTLLGTAASAYLIPLGTNTEALLVAAVLGLIAILTFIVLSEKTVFSDWNINYVLNTQNGEQEIADPLAGFGTTFHLTQREEEILYLLAQGNSALVISKELFIAEGTVKAHIQHIYQKLGVHTRKELMTLIENGNAPLV
ncbi:MAG: response regulator transcription factor [Coriobacteriales bacterium]|nr:response regulator transcription factor [Coriobacteriales bacterium]